MKFNDTHGKQPPKPVIFISAGEASGDQHGAGVARELKKRIPSVRLFGLGGDQMRAEGVDILAGLDELAVMGSREVLKKLPFFIRLHWQATKLFKEENVQLVIPIDYPGFNLRLARSAHRQGRQVLYFIAPQVWAWKEGRSKLMARVCDRILTVLPFEKEFLEKRGVSSDFVGHPLLDHIPEAVLQSSDSTKESLVIGLFPGSREQEVRLMLPIFAETAMLIQRRHPKIKFLVARSPNVSRSLYDICNLPTASSQETRELAQCALTKSGTITLELALAGIPMVVGYRTTPFEFALARRLIRVPSITLVNLVAGESIVPEFIQDQMTPQRLADALEPLLESGTPARETMTGHFHGLRKQLGAPGAVARVADHALDLLV
jgi:lipid-A-disaccharide synthase